MSKSFIFNENIDLQSINDLYGDDYQMIGEVFASVLNELDPLIDTIIACYEAEDLPALRAAVHKIKPLFGFSGLISIESNCLQFENTCQKTPFFDALKNEFTLLRDNLLKGKAVLEAEKERLRVFNVQ